MHVVDKRVYVCVCVCEREYCKVVIDLYMGIKREQN